MDWPEVGDADVVMEAAHGYNKVAKGAELGSRDGDGPLVVDPEDGLRAVRRPSEAGVTWLGETARVEEEVV